MSRIFILILIASLPLIVSAQSASPTPAPTPEPDYLLSTFEPYVPRDTDYSLEFGVMAEKHSLYWFGGNMGRHLGRCLFTHSETCQQYLDGIVGIGGRDGEQFGIFLGSVRWQFVNFPRSWSPLVRVFAGETYAHLEEIKQWRFTYGVGLGVTTYLHERTDLRFEVRGGEMGPHPFGQALIGVQFKADRLMEYFANKLVELGLATANTAIKYTGKAVEATGVGISSALKGTAKALGADVDKKKSKKSKNETKSVEKNAAKFDEPK